MKILKDSREKGQVLVESAIVFPLMIFMTLGLMQLTLLQHGKVMMDYAAYAAARSGVVHSGSRAPMEAAANIALLSFDKDVSSFNNFLKTYMTRVFKGLLSHEFAELKEKWLEDDDSWINQIVKTLVIEGLEEALTNWLGPLPSWAVVKIVNPKPSDFGAAEEFDFDCLYSGSGAVSKNENINNTKVKCPEKIKNNILTVAVRYDFQMEITFVNWVIFEAWYGIQAGIKLTGAIWSTRYDTGISFANSNAMGADGKAGYLTTREYLEKKMEIADYYDDEDNSNAQIKERTYIKMRNNLKSYYTSAKAHDYKIPLYSSYSMRMHSNIFKNNVEKLQLK